MIMETLNTSSNILVGWWPVVVSVWTVITFILGLYARIINLRLESCKDDQNELRSEHDELQKKFDGLEKAFTDYQIQILRDYMPATDIKEMVADLKSYLIRIEGKVDGRAQA